MTPACFRDEQQYSEWLHLARYAREACTICDDCKPEYEEKMKAQGRCHNSWRTVQFVMQKKVKPVFDTPKKPLKSNLMEIQIDPLSW